MDMELVHRAVSSLAFFQFSPVLTHCAYRPTHGWGPAGWDV